MIDIHIPRRDPEIMDKVWEKALLAGVQRRVKRK
jgi:hypothetical protein